MRYCLSVRPSDRPSRCGLVSKRRRISAVWYGQRLVFMSLTAVKKSKWNSLGGDVKYTGVHAKIASFDRKRHLT